MQANFSSRAMEKICLSLTRNGGMPPSEIVDIDTACQELRTVSGCGAWVLLALQRHNLHTFSCRHGLLVTTLSLQVWHRWLRLRLAAELLLQHPALGCNMQERVRVLVARRQSEVTRADEWAGFIQQSCDLFQTCNVGDACAVFLREQRQSFTEQCTTEMSRIQGEMSLASDDVQ